MPYLTRASPPPSVSQEKAAFAEVAGIYLHADNTNEYRYSDDPLYMKPARFQVIIVNEYDDESRQTLLRQSGCIEPLAGLPLTNLPEVSIFHSVSSVDCLPIVATGSIILHLTNGLRMRFHI